MKIVVLDGYTLNPGDLSWEYLNQYGDVTIYDRTPDELIVSRIGDAEIIMVNKTPITQQTLAACPTVKLICVLATGYNEIDCQAAAKRNIPVCNVPAYGTNAVAQFTIALLLELCHQVGRHADVVRQGDWCNSEDFCFWNTPQTELWDKTIGIIGFGRIGQAVGKIAKALGMNVLAYNRSRSPEGAAIGTYVDLDTLLGESDIISLHCPLTGENAKLINPQTIGKMKNGALLVNTARGGLLDEQAVADALKSGKLRGLAADVVSQEPITGDNPLLTAPNCILTPHMAWAPVESRQRIMDCTEKNVQGFLSGKPVNAVNL